MMNLLAISMVLASMVAAGVWSPAPQGGGAGEQVILKGGHRAVVVEYADDSGEGNTRVSISPPLPASTDGATSGAGDKLSSAAGEVDGAHVRGPRELICDAYGKCKYKISGAIGNAKNKVTGTVQEVEEGAKEAAGSAADKAKEFASKATQAAGDGAEKAKEMASKAVETGAGKAKDAGDRLKKGASRAKEAAADTKDDLKRRGEDIADQARQSASRAGEATKKEISDIARRGREVVYDAATWLVSKDRFDSLMDLVHLLGFATAYGVAVWVTFVMSHLMARLLPRQQFGVVQSRIYPVYFKIMAASVGMALIGHVLGRFGPEIWSLARKLQGFNLAGAMALILANLLYLEPRASKVMMERMKLEKEEGRGVSRGVSEQASRIVDNVASDAATERATVTATRRGAAEETAAADRRGGGKGEMEKVGRRLEKLNSYSSLLNMVTLMGLTWHLLYLSQRLCVER